MQEAQDAAIERIQRKLGHTNRKTQKHYIVDDDPNIT
jgi:hypothetical protein